MLRSLASSTGLALAAACFAAPGLAVQTCSLNGLPVNSNNDCITEGKTGLMRSRYAEGGPAVRKQDPQNDSRSEQPTGTPQSFDAEGRHRGERIYDARGGIRREREFDERGTVPRDDEVFEDGSRKAVGR